MNDAKRATPAAELERQICSSTEPKNEREWWAHREIARLRDRLSVETLALVETLARAERAERAEAYAARMDALVTAARDLLAIIHRDGGHHCEMVGFETAAKDAARVVIEMRSALKHAEAELAAARVDAERYRWLRSAMDADISVVWGFGVVDVGLNAVVATYEEALFLDELDAAIDAVRGGEG